MPTCLDAAALAPALLPQGQGLRALNIPAAFACTPVQSSPSGGPGSAPQRQPTNPGSARGPNPEAAPPDRSQGLNNTGQYDGPSPAISQGYVLPACHVLQ